MKKKIIITGIILGVLILAFVLSSCTNNDKSYSSEIVNISTTYGSSITTTYGSSVTINSSLADGSGIAACLIEEGKFLVIYSSFSSGGSIRGCIVTPSGDKSFTVSGDVELVSGVYFGDGSSAPDIVKVDDGKFIIAGKVYDSAWKSYAYAISVSGDTISIGAKYEFYAGETRGAHLAKIDTDKAVLGYQYASTYYGRVLSVSGTTVSGGSEVSLGYTGGKAGGVARLEDNKVLFIYNANSATSFERRVGNISETTITLAGSATDMAADMWLRPRVFYIQDNKVGVIGYDNSQHWEVMILTSSGDTVTEGSWTELLNSSSYQDYPGGNGVGTDKFIVAVSDWDTNGKADTGNISTRTITFEGNSSIENFSRAYVSNGDQYRTLIVGREHTSDRFLGYIAEYKTPPSTATGAFFQFFQ